MTIENNKNKLKFHTDSKNELIETFKQIEKMLHIYEYDEINKFQPTFEEMARMETQKKSHSPMEMLVTSTMLCDFLEGQEEGIDDIDRLVDDCTDYYNEEEHNIVERNVSNQSMDHYYLHFLDTYHFDKFAPDYILGVRKLYKEKVSNLVHFNDDIRELLRVMGELSVVAMELLNLHALALIDDIDMIYIPVFNGGDPLFPEVVNKLIDDIISKVEISWGKGKFEKTETPGLVGLDFKSEEFNDVYKNLSDHYVIKINK